ncbi:2-oxoglutarate-dependent dioxygenase DAO [Camellia lanceoleosa]|uniref:2-oxoglutarate-dependent dioxygenase DAO n=1 Tax=Camellia lanceoleosa TaxID=1840588 RepID=A0ACC0HKW8_9ERIC|nr:2-oxoglutarate-dependent dioxygenase DAO [Camellia lanceoleosa]
MDVESKPGLIELIDVLGNKSQFGSEETEMKSTLADVIVVNCLRSRKIPFRIVEVENGDTTKLGSVESKVNAIASLEKKERKQWTIRENSRSMQGVGMFQDHQPRRPTGVDGGDEGGDAVSDGAPGGDQTAVLSSSGKPWDDEIVGGLEVVHGKTGECVHVDPMPDSLLVNLGDMATIWSNGRLPSVKHKVQCYEGKTRFSTAFFVFGPNDRGTEQPPELVDSQHPRLYNPINFEEYRLLRISNNLPTGAFELLRINS